MTTRTNPRRGRPGKTATVDYPPEDMLLVAVKRDVQGATYALDSRAEFKVAQAFPEARGLPLVALGYENSDQLEERHRSYWELVGQLLTDLTPAQIHSLGGMRFCEPLDDFHILWEWRPGTPASGEGKVTLVRTEGMATATSCSDGFPSSATSK